MSTSSKKIDPKDISIVIPVKNNQSGIESLLKALNSNLTHGSLPRELIIIDNNSDPCIEVPSNLELQGLTIKLLKCNNLGPAAARNVGAKNAKGTWLLFVDSDCILSKSLLNSFIEIEGTLAFAGKVMTTSSNCLSNYYVSQQIHYPPLKKEDTGMVAPQYLITANALVKKSAFEAIGGFNESFTMAGGEDIDLGLRLSKIGNISYAPNSIVYHQFDDGLVGFMKRFVRYGKGNRLLMRYHKVNYFPFPSTAKNKRVIVNNFLVLLQWFCLMLGFLQMDYDLKRKKNHKPLYKLSK